jgi:hypothetical protein
MSYPNWALNTCQKETYFWIRFYTNGFPPVKIRTLINKLNIGLVPMPEDLDHKIAVYKKGFEAVIFVDAKNMYPKQYQVWLSVALAVVLYYNPSDPVTSYKTWSEVPPQLAKLAAGIAFPTRMMYLTYGLEDFISRQKLEVLAEAFQVPLKFLEHDMKLRGFTCEPL